MNDVEKLWFTYSRPCVWMLSKLAMVMMCWGSPKQISSRNWFIGVKRHAALPCLGCEMGYHLLYDWGNYWTLNIDVAKGLRLSLLMHLPACNWHVAYIPLPWSVSSNWLWLPAAHWCSKRFASYRHKQLMESSMWHQCVELLQVLYSTKVACKQRTTQLLLDPFPNAVTPVTPYSCRLNCQDSQRVQYTVSFFKPTSFLCYWEANLRFWIMMGTIHAGEGYKAAHTVSKHGCFGWVTACLLTLTQVLSLLAQRVHNKCFEGAWYLGRLQVCNLTLRCWSKLELHAWNESNIFI